MHRIRKHKICWNLLKHFQSHFSAFGAFWHIFVRSIASHRFYRFPSHKKVLPHIMYTNQERTHSIIRSVHGSCEYQCQYKMLHIKMGHFRICPTHFSQAHAQKFWSFSSDLKQPNLFLYYTRSRICNVLFRPLKDHTVRLCILARRLSYTSVWYFCI